MSPLPIFFVIAFLVLRLSFSWRWRTVLLVAVVLAVLGDFVVDLLVTFRAR